ncbi:hypothetical protein [Nonomuraea jabiensis]|uniref:Uncharacterized protein n=1 Tax=Nonomuraea jabiensis TaxID=882448 RepID=A0A7W9LGS2_9ACTN|nr:hypothetical protein [Nonomuraea jabiensis]MBB5783148.1 hypothetical protein [Nonomuraea jabiensis]
MPEIVEEARTTPPTEIPDGDVQRPFAIATEPDRTLVATVSETDIGIGMPEADGAGSQPLPGLVTYAAKQPSVAYAHQRTGQIARALTIIKDASAPTEYRFPISAPEGSVLEVETSYRVEGMTLVQTVDHAGAAYPVVAGPALKLQCEWWKAMCRLIFSKKLTKKIYNAWFVASVAGAIEALKGSCDKLKGKAKLICKVAYTTGGASAIHKVREAARKNQCFAIRFQAPVIVWYEVRKKSCQSK